MSVGFSITNKLQQVGKSAKTEYTNNEVQLYNTEILETM